MRRPVRSLLVASLLTLVVLMLVPGAVVPAPNRNQEPTVTVEWLGWNFYRFTSPTGKVILANPFVANPDSPVRLDDLTRVDLILVTNGHPDEIGQAVEIAQQTGAPILVGSFGFSRWFTANGIPAAQIIQANPGHRIRFQGLTIRPVQAIHGSDLFQTGRGTQGLPVQSMGIAAAFVITFENGWTLYYGGSSAATHDQALVGELYQPDAAIIYMGENTEPLDFAAQVRFLMTDNPNLRTLFPGHHRFLQEVTTVAEVEAALRRLGIDRTVIEPAPGQPFTFTK